MGNTWEWAIWNGMEDGYMESILAYWPLEHGKGIWHLASKFGHWEDVQYGHQGDGIMYCAWYL
jgi:hypothetical protein